MAPRYNLNHATPYPFMTCVVKVSTEYYGRGERTIAKVLDKCHGVHNFRMDENGTVEISGCVDPTALLKMLGRAGRSAELCWFQFGECSNNLFMPSAEGGSYSHDGRYLHAPSNVSRPKPPSHQPITNHGGGYGYDQYGNTTYTAGHYSSYGNQLGYYGGAHAHDAHAHAHAHACAHAHGYPTSYEPEYQSTGYRYGGNGRRSHDDAVCCTIM